MDIMEQFEQFDIPQGGQRSPNVQPKKLDKPEKTLSIWSEEVIAFARKLWDESNSGGIIAQKISEAFSLQVTRNAVLGKAHRLGWPDHANAVHHKTRERIERPRRRKKLPPQLIETMPTIADDKWITTEGVLFLEFRLGQCQYPDPHSDLNQTSIYDFRVCGRDVREGSPYCAVHHARCRRPNIKK